MAIVENRTLPFDLTDVVRAEIKSSGESAPGKLLFSEPGHLVDTEDVPVWLPQHTPRLAFDSINRATTLFAECARLRDRIEALQLDIFNYHQFDTARTDAIRLRSIQKLEWIAEKLRLIEVQRISKLIESHRKYNFSACETSTAWYENDTQHTVGLRNLIIETLNATQALNDAGARLIEFDQDIARVKAGWGTDDTLYEAKKKMMASGGNLALEDRLSGALRLYFDHMARLKAHIFSAEWGLSHVFGIWPDTKWNDGDVIAQRYKGSLDDFGRLLLQLIEASYDFQMTEETYSITKKIHLTDNGAGAGIGQFDVELPENRLSLLKGVRVRGADAGTLEIEFVPPAATSKAKITFPEWLDRFFQLDSTDPDAIADKRDIPKRHEAIANQFINEGRSFYLSYLVSDVGDTIGIVSDRSLLNRPVTGTWKVTVRGNGYVDILSRPLIVDLQLTFAK